MTTISECRYNESDILGVGKKMQFLIDQVTTCIIDQALEDKDKWIVVMMIVFAIPVACIIFGGAAYGAMKYHIDQKAKVENKASEISNEKTKDTDQVVTQKDVKVIESANENGSIEDAEIVEETEKADVQLTNTGLRDHLW